MPTGSTAAATRLVPALGEQLPPTKREDPLTPRMTWLPRIPAAYMITPSRLVLSAKALAKRASIGPA